MTEVVTETTEQQSSPALVRHAFYNRYGIVLFAVNDGHLVGIQETDDTPFIGSIDTAELLEQPGTDEWVARMVRARSTLARDLQNARDDYQRLLKWKEGLGEALLQEANDRDWCSEYDNFAEEWDLPKRVAEYDVTVTVRVLARDEEAAIDIVREEVSISAYRNDNVVDDPEYDANKVY